MDWALSARFRADRDVVIANGFPGFYMDPTMDEAKTIAKMGFDLTADGRPMTIERHRPTPPKTGRVKRFASVREALAEKPLFFYELMDAMGSDDGREVAEDVNKLYIDGIVTRKADGEWALV
jgi:2,5-furandicarboxylate decarboxylase 1